jgi:hypothetical protein
MIFDLVTFTVIHTVISLVALVAGVVVAIEVTRGRASSFWTVLFLATAIATSATGFGFPFNGLLPSHVIAIIALVLLAVVLVASYVGHLAGAWRWIYAVGIMINAYFLVFVGIVQAFQKIPALKSLAPTQAELPFAAVQIVALIVFIVLGVAALRSSARLQPA